MKVNTLCDVRVELWWDSKCWFRFFFNDMQQRQCYDSMILLFKSKISTCLECVYLHNNLWIINQLFQLVNKHMTHTYCRVTMKHIHVVHSHWEALIYNLQMPWIWEQVSMYAGNTSRKCMIYWLTAYYFWWFHTMSWPFISIFKSCTYT